VPLCHGTVIEKGIMGNSKLHKNADLPILVFADGAASGNPGPGGWGSIVASPDGQITELGGGISPTTNNRMELAAVVQALNLIQRAPALKTQPIAVFTDSTYVIRGFTQWIWGWRKRGWKTAEGSPVINQDLWEALSLAAQGLDLEWKYVRGHTGVAGNERVDQIAVAYSKNSRIDLYLGSLLKYSVPIHDLPDSFDLPEMREKSGPKPSAYSYLSVVNGELARHVSWPDCEARVTGRPGAKFKKVMSAQEESELLASWGFSVSDIK